MGETAKPAASGNKTLPIILVIVGIIALIGGILVATVHGTHLRGSGLGTVLIVLGIVIALVGFWRFRAAS